jgi:hypothetical protein
MHTIRREKIDLNDFILFKRKGGERTTIRTHAALTASRPKKFAIIDMRLCFNWFGSNMAAAGGNN